MDWCCLYRVLSLQDDFTNEKPMIQHYVEGWSHVCIFLPKFHCKLNTIEMLWGFMKYSESISLLIHISFPLIDICNRIPQIFGRKVHNCTKTCATVPWHVWYLDHMTFFLEILEVYGFLQVSYISHHWFLVFTDIFPTQERAQPCRNCFCHVAVQISP